MDPATPTPGSFLEALKNDQELFEGIFFPNNGYISEKVPFVIPRTVGKSMLRLLEFMLYNKSSLKWGKWAEQVHCD